MRLRCQPVASALTLLRSLHYVNFTGSTFIVNCFWGDWFFCFRIAVNQFAVNVLVLLWGRREHKRPQRHQSPVGRPARRNSSVDLHMILQVRIAGRERTITSATSINPPGKPSDILISSDEHSFEQHSRNVALPSNWFILWRPGVRRLFPREQPLAHRGVKFVGGEVDSH